MRGGIAAGAAAGLGLGAAAGVLWAGEFYARVLLAPVGEYPYPEQVRAAGDGRVTLAPSRLVRQPGVWGLRWPTGPASTSPASTSPPSTAPLPIGSASLGPAPTTPGTAPTATSGLAVMGEILGEDRAGVHRVLAPGPVPPLGSAVVDAGPFDPDPGARGLEFAEVAVPTPLGPAPAWEIPAGGDVWAVAVHGRGGQRREALRILPALHRLDLPTLVISYRNDDEAPPSPDGAYHLGDTEWEDLAAGVRYAREQGAKRIVLVGWSMGAAISGAFLDRAPEAELVDAVVWDAPLLDWRATLRLQARNRLLPPQLVPLAAAAARRRIGIDFDRFDLRRSPPARRPPTLIVHSTADTAVPVATSRALAAAGRDLDWPVRLVEVPGVEHTAAWNADPARYERIVSDFVREIVEP